MKNIFAYQSSDVDWCEGNFEHSEYIAEYYNTVSNLTYFLVAPIMVWLNQSYIRYRPIPIPGFTVMMVITGIFSAYFHMTLSYAGQLLDELSILWTLAASYIWWLPQPYIPAFIKNRKQFTWLIFFVTLSCTIMSFVKPVLNAYVLNCMAGHVFYMVISELRMYKDPKLIRLSIKPIMWWTVGISCWLIDKFFCNFCQKINFCYLHSLWHVFTAVSLLFAVPMFACFDVLRATPSANPQIAYWPSGNSLLKVPYITLQNPQKRH